MPDKQAKAEVIRLLEAELDLIEGGGYAPGAGSAGNEKPMFLNSLVCINHWLVPGHGEGCHDDCILLDAVPEGFRNETLPCHFIPLNSAGDTVHSLTGDRERLEEAVKAWIRRTIERLKNDEAALGLSDVQY